MDGLYALADLLWNDRRVGIASILILSVLIFLLLVRIEKKYFPKKRPNVAYIPVNGKLVRIKRKYNLWRGMLVTSYVFWFTTEGGDKIEANLMPGLMDIDNLHEGQKVKICYNPHNPYDFFIS